MSGLCSANARTEEAEAALRDAIHQASASLCPDEDDLAVAEHYPVPSGETKERARAFALRVVIACGPSAQRLIPRFGAAGDGGAGLHWKTETLELLITITPDEASEVRYYGDTRSGSTIKGVLAPDAPVGFLARWLVENAFPPECKRCSGAGRVRVDDGFGYIYPLCPECAKET